MVRKMNLAQKCVFFGQKSGDSPGVKGRIFQVFVRSMIRPIVSSDHVGEIAVKVSKFEILLDQGRNFNKVGSSIWGSFVRLLSNIVSLRIIHEIRIPFEDHLSMILAIVASDHVGEIAVKVSKFEILLDQGRNFNKVGSSTI